MESGEWKGVSGECRVGSGEWRVESGKCRVESGEMEPFLWLWIAYSIKWVYCGGILQWQIKR